MATTASHRIPATSTMAPAINGLTGYEDAATFHRPHAGDPATPPGPAPQDPDPTASAAHWPTSAAPARMHIQLTIGNMDLTYTVCDPTDRDVQDRMARLLPWLTEVMAACEANYAARLQAVAPSTPPTPPAPAPERPLDERNAAAVQAARPAQATASRNGAVPATDGRRPPFPSASEGTNDMDPSWCAIHQCQMQRRSNARGSWYSHRLRAGVYCKGE